MWGEGRGVRCNLNGRRPTAMLSHSLTSAVRVTQSFLCVSFTAESATTTTSTCTRRRRGAGCIHHATPVEWRGAFIVVMRTQNVERTS